MNFLRSLIFQVVFYAWTIFLGVLCLPVLLMPRRAVVVLGRLWLCSGLWLLKRVVGLGYRIEGADNIPQGPVIFASKHQSAWDTMIVPVFIRDAAAIVKQELLQIPFYGWYATKHRMIGIDRKAGTKALRHMLDASREALAEGRPIVVFPEGTRTAPGERKPYHSGVAALYMGLGVPVVPMALNSGLFWGRRAFTKRPGCITLRFLPPIPPGLKRREFMARLEQTIESASEELIAAERDRAAAAN
jgi:1-acyl-sn-glycerol-3-phosphate acyltransferase